MSIVFPVSSFVCSVGVSIEISLLFGVLGLIPSGNIKHRGSRHKEYLKGSKNQTGFSYLAESHKNLPRI